MDNFTHTLCGLALARSRFSPRGPLVVPVLAVAANLPDADVVVALGGHLAYLRLHRGVTHSLPGLAIETVLLAAMSFGLGRAWRVASVRFFPLLVAAAIGLLSHLALDSWNTYGVRPWLPFSATRYFGDMVFIFEPWLWVAFGAAAYLGARRGRRAEAVWAVVASLAAVFLASTVGAGVAGVFAVLALLCAFLHPRAAEPERLRVLATMLVLVAAAAVAGFAVTSRLVLTRGLSALGRDLGDETVLRTSVSPTPATPWRAMVVAETAKRIHFASVDIFAGSAVPRGVLEKHLDDPALETIRDTPEVATWRSFARHPFVARSVRGVILGDARYDARPEASWCNIEVPLAPR